MSWWNKSAAVPILTPDVFLERAFSARRCSCAGDPASQSSGGTCQRRTCQRSSGQRRGAAGPPAGCQWSHGERESCRDRQAERERKGIAGRGNSLRENQEAAECSRAQGSWTVQVRPVRAASSVAFSSDWVMPIFRCTGAVDHPSGVVHPPWSLLYLVVEGPRFVAGVFVIERCCCALGVWGRA